MRAWTLIAMVATALALPPRLWSHETGEPAAAACPKATEAQPAEVVPAKHPLLMYIPNRLFDVLDIVRARVRVGPGLSVGMRATSMVQVFVGAHNAAYIGLPGPRGMAEVPRLVGYDVRPVEGVIPTYAPEPVPYYDPMEFQVEAQPLIAGVSVGVALMEVVDFVGGLLCIDIANDDF